MSQSLSRVLVHIIFSTKNRAQLLSPVINSKLYAFIGKSLQNRDCRPIKIGGAPDHIHIFCSVSKKYTLEDLIREIKTSSSKWIKTQGNEFSNFHWQRGYGMFSVSIIHEEMISNYINNQQQHHKKYNFQEEFRAFLTKYRIPFNEQYLWD